MKLRKMVVLLTALGAMGLMTGCDDGGGEEGNTCTADTDCTGNEICHPTALVCVSTCETGDDCTANAKTCEAITAGSATKICKCETTALCNTDRETADLICSTLDEVCVKPCGSDTDCGTGRTCDVASGQCQAGPTTTSCEGTAQSTCAYGEFCSANVCTPAPEAEASTCANFASNRPDWDPATSGGPVIYDVTKIQFLAQGDNTTCTPTQTQLQFSVRAYRTDEDWPATKSGLDMNGFFYVKTTTARDDIIARGYLIPDQFGGGYFRNPNNPRDAEFRVWLCPPSGTTSIPVGLFFTGGNPVCTTFTR